MSVSLSQTPRQAATTVSLHSREEQLSSEEVLAADEALKRGVEGRRAADGRAHGICGRARAGRLEVHRDGAVEIAPQLRVQSGRRRRSARRRRRQKERRRVAGGERWTREQWPGPEAARGGARAGGRRRLARAVHVEEAPVLAVERRVLDALFLECAARVREFALHLRQRARELLLEVANVSLAFVLAAALALGLCGALAFALVGQLLRPHLHLGGHRLRRLGRLHVRRAARGVHLIRELLEIRAIHKLVVQLFLHSKEAPLVLPVHLTTG